MTGFSHQAWQHTVKLQQAVLEHPFNEELAAGSLSRERFQFYLAQDARYLVGFGRALAVAAARAPDPGDLTFFAGAARESVVVERALHEGYFERFGLNESDLAAIETSPTCLGYTSYLLAVAQTEGYPELIAALLPCFWVYQHVGEDILRRQRPGVENPYRAWIDTYADEEFAASVRTCRQAVDRAAAAADEATRHRMLAAFTRASEYEWLFWDSAYRLETWPTAHFFG
ncbi:thiaminase II [Amycolatopsis nigrescens]|uniref:thiaminase II n=1 Tax=Amycolatopsis nigrescens TaxID=381445 RepID=UPI0004770FF6|nr:thiaminase II [Amycolatopsis nigrescens]